MKVAAMDGRSTPVRALTQMTNVQKATDSGTPANPTQGSGVDAVATTSCDASHKISRAVKSSSRAFGALNLRSTGAGARGAGFCSASSLLAQGHADNPSQQLDSAQWDTGFADDNGCNRANWIASPMISPTIVRSITTLVRLA